MNKPKNVRISESEWEVMRILWDAEGPLTAAEVIQEVARRLEGRTDWKPKTVRTFLNRLVNKQAISAEKIGPPGFELLHYAPLIDEPTTLHAEQETFLGRFFGGTIQSMLAAYIESGKITQQDLRELREMIDRISDHNSGSVADAKETGHDT